MAAVEDSGASIEQGVGEPWAAGTAVRLRARPSLIGIVVSSELLAEEVRYYVFHDGTTQAYFGSQLELHDAPSSFRRVTATALRATLTAELVRNKDTAYLHARNAGRIDYEPYQFRPVLKMVQADRPRILVADDVGVGKTIEACLVLKELQSRGRADNVLVICPKPLVVDDKWRAELKRFDEDFVHLDSRNLQFCLGEMLREGEWPRRYAKSILPYSLLDERLLVGDPDGSARRVCLDDVAPGPKFDLLIVDEAHHIRNRTTFAYQNVQRFAAAAEAVVMLSATPLQTRSEDLFTLVNLLRDDLVPTKPDFAAMLEPNQHLHEAAEAARAAQPGWADAVEAGLVRALSTPWGTRVLSVDPRIGQIRNLLRSDTCAPEERVRIVRTLEDLNTFSSIVTRTRRRDIGTFTTRKPTAPQVQFTPQQRDVYEALMELGQRIARLQAPGMPVAFLLSMLQRQAASSIAGLAPLVSQILNNRLDTVEAAEIDEDLPPVVPSQIGQLRPAIEALGQRTAALEHGPDPKVDLLEQIVHDKQGDQNNKVLVFSTFRHTLQYLENQARDWGLRVATVHGAIPDTDRKALRRRFKLRRGDPDAIDVMLCSEVGTEGLDYQFCNMLVNYDIPWNPMRIEQRIGRIDRRGQESESVSIVNILTVGTIEAEIYERCLSRIGVFHRALGGSEQILGDLTSQLQAIADDLTLSEADRADRLRQLADNEVARIQELERLEDHQGALLGLTTQAFEERVDEASSEWLAPERVGDLVRGYLQDVQPGRRLVLHPGRPSVARLDADAAARVLDDLRLAGALNGRIERALRRRPAVLNLTTDPDVAADLPDVELLNNTHPLVRTAAQHAALPGTAFSSLRVRTEALAPGTYPVAIHGWTRLDVRDSFTFRYVSTDPKVESVAVELITAADDGMDSTLDTAVAEALDARHHGEWSRARAEHVDRATTAARQRAASFRAQRDGRLAVIKRAEANAADAKIRRMRQSEAATVQSEFDSLIAAQDRAAKGADLVTRHIATILLEVEA